MRLNCFESALPLAEQLVVGEHCDPVQATVQAVQQPELVLRPVVRSPDDDQRSRVVTHYLRMIAQPGDADVLVEDIQVAVALPDGTGDFG